MNASKSITRRTTLKGIGSLGAMALCSTTPAQTVSTTNNNNNNFASDPIHQQIEQKVFQTPFIDTHEHLPDEKDRLAGTAGKLPCDDWALLLKDYLSADMLSAQMWGRIRRPFFSPKTDPLEKWKLLEPYWPAVKNTGYAQAVRIAIKQLYNIDDLSAETIAPLQAAYKNTRRPGFYKHILRDLANIESCQVNGSSSIPFHPSDMPDLLMQDLSILDFILCKNIDDIAKPTGISVDSLADWHSVIDWWFEKYGPQAVAVKTQHAYDRSLDHPWTTAESVEKSFKALINKNPLADNQKKALQDHLFWYTVQKAAEHKLPVKIHTGYYSGTNKMPLARVSQNPKSAADICLSAQKHDSVSGARFVFMHIGYPYYEEMIALAKQFSNAFIDMCWSWIINPVAAQDFLEKFIVTSPANKLLTFGGDYNIVEPVLGHATLARRGITNALAGLVDRNYLTTTDALELIPLIMNGNAKILFNLPVSV